jgi:hypothetical protein
LNAESFNSVIFQIIISFMMLAESVLLTLLMLLIITLVLILLLVTLIILNVSGLDLRDKIVMLLSVLTMITVDNLVKVKLLQQFPLVLSVLFVNLDLYLVEILRLVFKNLLVNALALIILNITLRRQ